MKPILYGEIPQSAVMNGGGGLVLSQLNVPGFVDSPWEVLHFGKSDWGCTAGEELEKRWKGELWFGYKMKLKKTFQ